MNLKILPNPQGYSQSELNVARYLAQQGYEVILRPPTDIRQAGRTSDLLVDGVPYDVFTPKTANVNRVVSAIAKKNSQAEGVALDLTETVLTASDLPNLLKRVQGALQSQDVVVNIRKIIIYEGDQ